MIFTRDPRIWLAAAAVLALSPAASAAPGTGWRGEAEAVLSRGDLDAVARVYDRALATDGDSAERSTMPPGRASPPAARL